MLLAGLALALTAHPTPSLAQAFTVGLRLDIPVDTNPRSVAIGDLNGDGRLDLVVTAGNGVSSGVSVLLGDGAGGFGTKASIVMGTTPFSVAIGDLNGDGRPDLVTADLGAGAVSVLLGNGAGGFGARRGFPTGAGPRAVAIGDVNGDGRPDLVTANSSSNTVSVLLGDGAGGFAANTEFGTGGFPSSVAIVDVNGDGRPDLALGNLNDYTVSVLLGDGAGGFTNAAGSPFTTGSSPISLVGGDVNGDGRPDLVVATGLATVSVLLGDGAGGFGAHTDFAAGTSQPGVTTVAIGDVNGDGRPDLAVTNSQDNAVSVLPGDGAGGFGAITSLATGAFPFTVAIADVNGDGRPDLAVANYNSATVSVLESNGAGGFGARTDFAAGTYPQSVAIGDVSSDGKPDLVVANGYLSGPAVSVLLGDGVGAFGARTEFATGSVPFSVAMADVNGDGRPDLATANYLANTVSVLLGNGSGGFGAKSDFTTGSAPFSVAIGDVSGDSRPDLVVANYGASSVSVLLGNGAGSFGAQATFATGVRPVSVAIGDMNADGRLDLATANYAASTVSVLLGNGVGGFGVNTDFATGTGPQSVAMGDVNGDGKPDLAVANYNDYTVSVLLGNGAGGFGVKTDFATGTGPYSVAIADVNGDGRPDLAVANYLASTVSVLLGNGSGGFGAKADFTTGVSPFSVAIGDLNADGRLDLATANIDDYTVSVRLGLAPTRTMLAASPNPAVLGSPLTLSATVSILAPGYGAPGDSVRFFDGTTLLGTSSVHGGVAGLALFAPYLGDRPISAAYKGDGKRFGSLSAVRPLHVVSTARPTIASIADVKNDQGGTVRLVFGRSPFDYLGSGTPITSYQVYRRGITAAAARARPAGLERASDPLAVQLAGWDYVTTLPATTEGTYQSTLPTFADSNASGVHRVVLFVRAATATPSVYFDSPADSGYSVDNLPPAPPAPFTAAYKSGATHLHWGANPAPDLRYYQLYRGGTAGFTPGPGNLIATTADTGYVDVGAAGSYYKLAAVDVNGNASGYALLTPGGTTDAGEGASLSFALDGVRPNPARSGRLRVAFALPSGASARLELLDVSGRRVEGLDVGELGAGRHVVELGRELSVAPGLYLVRLTQGVTSRTVRAIVIE